MTSSEVFISYAWGGESEEIANKVDAAFMQNQIAIIRDKRDLGFKGLITDFMKQIGKGKAVITIISDKYLKSPYCMFELLEIFRNSNFSERIFPILLSDAKIFEPISRLGYLKYWQDKKKELDNAIRQYGADAITVIGDDFIIYKRICDNIGEIVNLLKDINALTPEMHMASRFQKMLDAVNTVFEIDQKTKTDQSKENNPEKTSVIPNNPVNSPEHANRNYNIPEIRKLLNTAFDDIALQNFCMDYFEPVYNNFATGQNKTQRITALIDYCRRFMKIEQLLDCIKQYNPDQYNNFKLYI